MKLTFKAYKKLIKYFSWVFFLYIKMVNNYYQKHKEKLSKQARERHQNFSEEEKTKGKESPEKDIKN